MKAMVLGAGKGTRVRPVTNQIPKPMIPLVNKPILEYIVQHLKAHGVDQIVVNTSYLSEKIESYFSEGRQFDVQMSYSFEGHKVDGELIGNALGSAGGMRRVQDATSFFDDTFLVLCGDALIDLDIGKVVEFHKRNRAIATIALKEVANDEVDKYGIVQLDDTGRIRGFQEKPASEEALSNLANTGIYVFEPEIFDFIPPERKYDIGGDLFPRIVEEGLPFFGIADPFQWIDIGSIPDFWEATRMMLRGEIRGVTMPGTQVAPGIWVGSNVRLNLQKVDIEGPVYIGNGSIVRDSARIVGPTVLGANSLIEAGAVVEGSILDSHTRVGSGAWLREQIVFNGYCADRSGANVDISESAIEWLVDDARAPITDQSDDQRLISDTAASAERIF